MLINSLIMEKDLDFIIEKLKKDTKIKYGNKNNDNNSHRFGELVIYRHKLNDCPDVHKFINRLERKISKTSTLRGCAYTRQLCVLLLVSLGYSVNSSVFDNISNQFIEKCWDCIQYIIYTIKDPVKSWLLNVVDGRTPSSFSALFCPTRQLPERVSIDNISSNKFKSVREIDLNSVDIPQTIWHRDDVVIQTILGHFKSFNQSS